MVEADPPSSIPTLPVTRDPAIVNMGREFDTLHENFEAEAMRSNPLATPDVIIEAYAGLEPGFILSHEQIAALSNAQQGAMMERIRGRLTRLISSPVFQNILQHLPEGSRLHADNTVRFEDLHALNWTMGTMEKALLTREQIDAIPTWLIGALATEARCAIAEICDEQQIKSYGNHEGLGAILKNLMGGDVPKPRKKQKTHSDTYAQGPIDPDQDLPSGTLRLISDPAELRSFADVIGLEEQINRLKPCVLRLTRPEIVTTPMQHVLLTGPHGTGKSLVAEALAHSVLSQNSQREKPVKFAQVNLPSVFWKWVGESNANTSRMLKFFEENAPIIVFMDEIEAGLMDPVAAQMHEESLRVQNTILQWMSGMQQRRDVLIIGATNRPNLMNAGFLRSGRFGRNIEIPHPSFEALIAMFESRIAKIGAEKVIEPAHHRNILQRHTLGTCAEADAFTGADIDGWMSNIEDHLLIAAENDAKKMPTIDCALIQNSYDLLVKDRAVRRSKLATSEETHTCDINSPIRQLFRMMHEKPTSGKIVIP